MTDLLAKAAKVLEARTDKTPWKRQPIDVRYTLGQNRQINHNWNAIDGIETCTAETHIGTSPWPDPFYIALPDAEVIALLGTVGDQLLAVARAAKHWIDTAENAGSPTGYDQAITDMNACFDAGEATKEALAALDSRLAEYFKISKGTGKDPG